VVYLDWGNNDTSHNGCTICTRAGNPIPYRNTPIPPSQFAEQIKKRFVNEYSVVIRSEANYPYNCVGMVFASRRAVIDDSEIGRILAEDNYKKINREQVIIGDVIAYIYEQKFVHVGIIFEKTLAMDNKTSRFRVISKWGEDLPEFIHFEDIVPEMYGSPDFYTDRNIK